MSGIFDDPIFAAIFGSWPEPPEAIPLRVLDIEALPKTSEEARRAVQSAFRGKALLAHPDLRHAFKDPTFFGKAAEEAIEKGHMPEIQELVWARDVLLRKIPEAPQGGNKPLSVTAKTKVTPCSLSSPVTMERRDDYGWETITVWTCHVDHHHGSGRFEKRPKDKRRRLDVRKCWERVCKNEYAYFGGKQKYQRCRSCDQAHQRELRRRRRPPAKLLDLTCASCNTAFSSKRREACYCSDACRQRCYRQRGVTSAEPRQSRNAQLARRSA